MRNSNTNIGKYNVAKICQKKLLIISMVVLTVGNFAYGVCPVLVELNGPAHAQWGVDFGINLKLANNAAEPLPQGKLSWRLVKLEDQSEITCGKWQKVIAPLKTGSAA